jgi:HPt (histidine-containing phosphotransfer) domain-containing protein
VIVSRQSFENRPTLAAIARDFIAALPGLAAEIGVHAAAGALEPARRLAHRLKGSAGGYGFPAIMRTAAAVEASARCGDVARVRELAIELQALCDRAANGEETAP